MKGKDAIHVGIDAFRLVGPRTSIGTYTHELIAALILKGFRITLYAPRKEEGADLEMYEEGESHCDLVYAPKPSEPEKRPSALLLWNQLHLPKMMRAHPCDVFIAPYQQVPCFTPNRIPTLVVIHDLCGLRRDCGYRTFGRAWARHFWNLLTAALRATRIVPISMSTRDDMIAKFPFCKSRLAEPIYNQVSGKTLDCSEAALQTRPFGVSPGGFILAFGITGPRKAIEIALEGYAIYRKRGGKLPLVLIGVVDKQAISRYLPKEWVNDIKLIPRVSVCERDSLYRLATCLLFCSRCEGFGYPVVEAMRQGCAVIASETTPAKEIVGETLNLMSKPDSAECAKLIDFYSNMDAESRELLRESLILRSNFFSSSTFSNDFSREIEALAHSK